jgi:hypothetical protein
LRLVLRSDQPGSPGIADRSGYIGFVVYM